MRQTDRLADKHAGIENKLHGPTNWACPKIRNSKNQIPRTGQLCFNNSPSAIEASEEQLTKANAHIAQLTRLAIEVTA